MLYMILMGVMMTSIGQLVTGPVETVGEGFEFTEGPVWLPSGELLFSDIPADTIYTGDKTVFRKPSGKSNGLTLDAQGRLVACEHWNRRVSRTEKDGSITVLADSYQGKRLNSPNDVVIRSDGMIFFTDPPYGLEGREAELPFAGVFSLAPGGDPTLLVEDFDRPNGLAFSPDERTLYVADTRAGHIRAFDVAEDGALSNGRIFCNVQNPDGIRVDLMGQVWATAKDGVVVFSSEGDRVGVIELPQQPTNCAFGDVDSKTLYITARKGVYKVRCAVAGIHPAMKKQLN